MTKNTSAEIIQKIIGLPSGTKVYFTIPSQQNNKKRL